MSACVSEYLCVPIFVPIDDLFELYTQIKNQENVRKQIRTRKNRTKRINKRKRNERKEEEDRSYAAVAVVVAATQQLNSIALVRETIAR